MFSDNNDDDNKVMTIGRIDIDASKFVKKPDLSCLPILVTKNLVLFPEVVVPVALGRESAIRLASQASKDATPIGVVCQ
ncbi:MAG: LON peptidase substrate-binding domain-containing protein, partial [Muribaculaceae bacterium]|nr:LON peptidase substrate-binding domain-containing protein [Muribaculaceae bacterium]